jgi:Cellulase (glycosyl hydrolase family 5)
VSRRSLLPAFLCVLIAGLLLAPSLASAAGRAEVSIMDDQLLLGRSQSHVDRQMRLFRRLGIDRVRVSAFWNGATSPNAGSATKPAGFNTSNPNDPNYAWGALDRVVNSARSQGLRVMLSITTPAPRWATNGGEPLSPRPGEFAAFSEAVARRYAGAVDHYGVANEPNQPGWLRPQTDSRGLFSPHLYRAMLQGAYPRIKAADPGSVVLAGNLASSGVDRPSPSTGIRPLAFLRAMACVDRSLRPITTGRCAGYRPVPADAFGHHPYKFFGSPRRRSRKGDDAAIGDGRRLLRTLDRLQARGRIVKSTRGRFSVFYTEFGYQTNPPDPFAGVSLRSHNRFLQEAAYLVWRTPRLRAVNQFRLTDGPLRRARGLRRYAEFQSGILFANRRKKPAYRSFPDPFVIDGSRFWGQVRPGGRHSVRLQYRRSRGRFRTVKRARTDSAGYFRVRAKRRKGQYRYSYRGGASDTLRIR